MPRIDTANGAIWFADHHDATAHLPVTLLIHGAGWTHQDWPAEVRRMPEANAIAPDLPGHGRSSGPGRRTIAAYASDMLALLDALKIRSAIVGGHSMGGAIAMYLAIHYPERVQGLILVGTGAKLGVHPDILNNLLTDTEKSIGLIIEWSWSEAAIEQVRRVSNRVLLETPAQVTHGDYTACNAFDVRNQLHLIKTPTLVIGASADKMTPPHFSAYLHEHISGSQLAMIEGAGHMMALEQPEAVANAIQGWFAGQRGSLSA